MSLSRECSRSFGRVDFRAGLEDPRGADMPMGVDQAGDEGSPLTAAQAQPRVCSSWESTPAPAFTTVVSLGDDGQPGLTAKQALFWATGRAACRLGLHEVGVLESGRWADFVVLESDLRRTPSTPEKSTPCGLPGTRSGDEEPGLATEALKGKPEEGG
ncbi:MAG: amidohydrolase family protein, partial [Acidobacteriota bacterium]